VSTVGSRALSVAKVDFLNVRRAKLVWGPVVLYTIFMFLFFWGQSNADSPDFYAVLWGLIGIGGVLVVPLIALVAAYLSIAGEVESGSITYSLGLPVSRGEFVAGKFLSRAGVVVVGIVVSFLLGSLAGFVFVPGMEFEYGDYALFVAVTSLYGLAYVSVALAISAMTASRSRAMSGAIGFFFLFNIVWNFLPVGPVQMLEFLGDQFDVEFSDSFLELVFSLSPTGAYLNSSQLLIPDRFLQTVGGAASSPSDPFYIQGWFMLVIMAGWVVVPMLVGYWRFRTAQLG
jgi:ABC-2 type transport system permease protein